MPGLTVLPAFKNVTFCLLDVSDLLELFCNRGRLTEDTWRVWHKSESGADKLELYIVENSFGKSIGNFSSLTEKPPSAPL